ncbi:MAG TPA: hypothetical protein VMG60_11295 [Burkholderiaceae bacterium]|nr:hypothetical protein [Burkholderiaceae bacterium]
MSLTSRHSLLLRQGSDDAAGFRGRLVSLGLAAGPTEVIGKIAAPIPASGGRPPS